MSIVMAWTILGKNWEDILNSISSMPDSKSRVDKIEEMLGEAKKLARQLMAANHPDVNPGDPDASFRFRTVHEALSVIERETQSARDKYENMVAARKRQADGFILIKQ